MNDTNPFEVFMSECPDIARAFNGLVDAQRNAPGMDSKTKQLVNIASPDGNTEPSGSLFSRRDGKKCRSLKRRG